MEADSSRSKQSAESHGSCRADLGSRGCGEALAKASESCIALEDLVTIERTNWKGSQIRSLSHQLIHSTTVTANLIKPRVGYRTINSVKSSEHDFILSSRNDNQSRGQETHSLVNLQYLSMNTMSLVHSRREETSN